MRNSRGAVLEARWSQTLAPGQWHHAVGTWDGASNTIRLHIDGEQKQEYTAEGFGPLSDTSAAFMIGANAITTTDPGVSYYAGAVDEVALFPFALTRQQANALRAYASVPWQSATLAQPGALATTWSFIVPEGVEGLFQINGRGIDRLGNRAYDRIAWDMWRGMVDTAVPRVSIQASDNGRDWDITCQAHDLNLIQTGYDCPCSGVTWSTYDQFSDWFRSVFTATHPLYHAYGACTKPGGPGSVTRACDVFGRCATAVAQQSASGADEAGIEVVEMTTPASTSTSTSTSTFTFTSMSTVIDTLPAECSTIGVNRAVAETAPPYAALHEEQRLQAAWDAATLYLTWTGANWYQDGDLFVYLRAGAAAGSADASGVILPFAATHAIRVTSGASAELLRWDAGQWVVVRPLTSAEYRFSDARRADLAVPFADLGVSDPAASPLDLVAFAAEKNAARLWAAMPTVNPLSSAVVGASAPSGSLALWHAYHWNALAPSACASDGVAPGDGRYLDVDLRGAIEAQPAGAVFDARPDGVYLAKPEPIDDTHPPLSPGQAVAYRLRYRNAGTAAAPAVSLIVTASGGLILAGGASQVFDLGPLAPGAEGEWLVNATATGGGAVARLDAELRSGLPGAAPAERFAVEHAVDIEPPSGVAVLAAWNDAAGLDWAVSPDLAQVTATGQRPASGQDAGAASVEPPIAARAGANLLIGSGYDALGLTQVEVELYDGQSTVRTAACQDLAPADTLWVCPVDLSGAQPGDQFLARARAADPLGRWSEWSAWRSLEVGPVTHLRYLPLVAGGW